MSRSGRRAGAYIRTPCQASTESDFRDALSEDETVRNGSDSSKRSGSRGPETLSQLCCTCDFSGTEDIYVACAICTPLACAEPRSKVASGHGEVMARRGSDIVPHHTQAALVSTMSVSRKRLAPKKRKQDNNLHAVGSELSRSQTMIMHQCESLAPLPPGQTCMLLSRYKLSWSLTLFFIVSITMCSMFSTCMHSASGGLPISGFICTGKFANACEGSGFAAMAPAVTFEAYQDAIEGINGLFARSDELRTEFGSSRVSWEWDELRRRFAEILERVKMTGRRGGNVLEALEAAQIFEFHADLALFVERLEDDAHIVPSSPTPPSGRKNDMRTGISVNANHKSSMARLEGLPQRFVDEAVRREQPFEEARLMKQSHESNNALMSMMSLAVS